MAETNTPDPLQWLVEEWARQLTTVLETMTGESPYVTFAAHSASASECDAASDLLWWAQPFSLGPESMMWVAAAASSWQQIGGKVLSSAGVEDGDPESIRSTYLEIVHQGLSGIAGALSGRAGREVSCQEGKPAAPPAPVDGSCYSFEVDLGELKAPLFVVFSPALGVVTEESTEDFPKPIEQPPTKAATPVAAKHNSIDLLLDVELPVSVSFGRAQLPLKDVIKLTTGSIVELNRAVSEPVDVIVNNCVIARGEVVVVEGNFGIRIRQVVSRQERLRTLY
ncbi:MAG TPA: flagellar motor switch protein FliN [Bryobacteraceae bacterium]|nr:flagellar motor switch protein FliN [Bryobacteraceae bacterium]